MKVQWPRVKLDHLTEDDRQITYGVVKPGDPVEDGIKFVRGGDVFQGRIALDKLRTISPQLSQTYKRTILQGGELLISLVGNPGEVAIVPPSLAGGNIARQVGLIALRPDIDARFAMYFLMSPNGRAELFTLTGGAVQQVINLADLKRVKIPTPPLSKQRKIAAILSGYDDLFENNLKRIALLEEAARQLYKEWFVRLRFPGHEHTSIVDGVPEGWSEGVIGTLAKVQSGYAFKSRDWLTEGNPVIKIKNIDNNTLDIDNCQCVSDEVAESAIKFQLQEGDFLIAMTGATIGKIGIMPRTQKRYYLNQRVGILRPTFEPNPIPFLFTFFNTENAQSQVLNLAGGAAQPNISPRQIESIKFLLPPESLFSTFIESCHPLFNQRLVLLEQNEKLKQASDLLLPRLMSGEILV